jgi:hypothetical protein
LTVNPPNFSPSDESSGVGVDDRIILLLRQLLLDADVWGSVVLQPPLGGVKARHDVIVIAIIMAMSSSFVMVVALF